jgi:hypothetical protein
LTLAEPSFLLGCLGVRIKAYLGLKNLIGAPLGQALALLVNLRLGSIVERTARDKHFNLFGPFINYKNINFITLILINI